MEPEGPGLLDSLRIAWNGLRNLFWTISAPIRGTSAAGAWLRLLLMFLGMLAAYFGLQAMLGDLPNLFKTLEKFFSDFRELISVLFKLFVPAVEPGPVAPGPGSPWLPEAPSAPWSIRLNLIFRRLSQDNLQDILIFGVIPLIWALGRAVDIFEDTFRLNSFRAVAENLLAGYIPLFRRDMEIREANLVMDVTTIHPRRVGGPLRLEVDADSLAVMEPIRGDPQLITATSSPVQIDAFERLHRILDLRQNPLELNQVLFTRDGVRVELVNAHFTYRIRHGQDGVDQAAAFSLVYHHWLGKSWENPTTRERDTRRLVERELAQFISDRKDLADVIPHALPLPAQAVIPLNWRLLQQFVNYFNNRLEHGLQLTWLEDGEWMLPPELSGPDCEVTLEMYRINHQLSLQLAQMDPRQLRDAEIRKMAQRVLLRVADLDRMGADAQTKTTRLLELYTALLGNQPV